MFWLGFVVGLFAGGIFGVFIIALVSTNKTREEKIDKLSNTKDRNEF